MTGSIPDEVEKLRQIFKPYLKFHGLEPYIDANAPEEAKKAYEKSKRIVNEWLSFGGLRG